jgi:hypothetical protein
MENRIDGAMEKQRLFSLGITEKAHRATKEVS